MNCGGFEKKIYLYRELTIKGKEITDQHMAHCESCRALAAQILQQQEMVRNVSSVKPAVKDPEWLTQRIMNSVNRKDNRRSRLDGGITFLNSLFVRYAFSALSILLIAVLYIEQQSPDQVQPIATLEIKEGAILNTSAFLKAHLNSRQKKERGLSISRYTYHQQERFSKTL
jgi:predicted anti-sigma-YlaC factor YlaD